MRQCVVLCILLLFAASTTLIAQDTLRVDDSIFTVRYPAKESIEKFKNDDTFLYDRAGEAPESIWDRIWRWLLIKLMKILNHNVYGNIITYGLITLFLVVLISKLLKTNLQSLFYKSKTAGMPLGFGVVNEDIYAIDLDKRIKEEVQNRNYRLATRYLYLKTLRQLSDRDYIKWILNKTNKDYINEIKKNDIKDKFMSLTAIYEFTWYGNFSLSENKFNGYYEQFQEFYKRVR